MNYKERTEKHIEELIANELAAANKKFPAFASAHEGWAVLKEEVEEAREDLNSISQQTSVLFDIIREHHEYDQQKEKRVNGIRKAAIRGINELIQVAAMCDKFKALGEEELQQKPKEYAAAALKPEINLVHDNLEKKYDTGSPLSMRMGEKATDPEIVEFWRKRGELATKTLNELTKVKKCSNCRYYGFHYWTPTIDPPICLNPKKQKAETNATWTCPEWEEREHPAFGIQDIEKETPTGDPLNMRETLAEKGAMSKEDLEAFNKNYLSQKLKNRCIDCGWLNGEICCGFHSVRVDADWTCGMWKTKGE